jgi:8-oxo-dGTP diphosphatase
MKVIDHLLDDQYPAIGVKEIRNISRAVVSDGHGHYAIHNIVRSDQFGAFDYYETPGGGVDEGETTAEACIRECREELGYQVKILAELGRIDDYYNLIQRENHNNFYLCVREGKDLGKKFVSRGDSLIHETLWLPMEEIIALYEKMPDTLLPGLVKRRELPIWRVALRLSKGK